MQSIYVAATSQHVGKTTCTLGLVRSFQKMGINVGYSKPVGQEFVDLGDLRVDKDALLFSKIIGFDLDANVHSPVILGRGATTAFLENPSEFAYKQAIINAEEELNKNHDLVVYEGTGHPGVGAVVNLSNAKVAKLLNAKVVMVVEGGIGNTIDRLHMSTSLFREQNVPIAGVVVNKTRPDKIDKVERYVGQWLKEHNLPLLGVIPYDPTLLYPIMSTIRRAVRGRVMAFETRLDNQVQDVIAGSLVSAHDFEDNQGHLLVVSASRVDEALKKVKEQIIENELESCPLSGVIITGDGIPNTYALNQLKHYDLIENYMLPVISTPLDTFGSVVKISQIEVKINVRTPWKAARAIALFRQHTDIEGLVGR